MSQKLFPRRRSVVSTLAMFGSLCGVLSLDRAALAQSDPYVGEDGGDLSGGEEIIGVLDFNDGVSPWDPLDASRFFDACDPSVQFVDADGYAVHPADIVESLHDTCMAL